MWTHNNTLLAVGARVQVSLLLCIDNDRTDSVSVRKNTKTTSVRDASRRCFHSVYTFVRVQAHMLARIVTEISLAVDVAVERPVSGEGV